MPIGGGRRVQLLHKKKQYIHIYTFVNVVSDPFAVCPQKRQPVHQAVRAGGSLKMSHPPSKPHNQQQQQQQQQQYGLKLGKFGAEKCH
mmetsp:Transcript_36755/g.66440  ORF Transcript_36755/g.66440 Transcript_36755/m.66440 type:complete len:88 (+) Transcript_36755:120-383(+)